MPKPIDPFVEAMKRAMPPGPGEAYQWWDLSDPERNAAGRATPVPANDGSAIEVGGLTLCRIDSGAVRAGIRDVEAKSAAAIESALERMVGAALELGGIDVQAMATGATGTVALITTVDAAGNLLIKPVALVDPVDAWVEVVARELCKFQEYDPDGISFDRHGASAMWTAYSSEARSIVNVLFPLIAEHCAEKTAHLTFEQADTP